MTGTTIHFNVPGVVAPMAFPRDSVKVTAVGGPAKPAGVMELRSVSAKKLG